MATLACKPSHFSRWDGSSRSEEIRSDAGAQFCDGMSLPCGVCADAESEPESEDDQLHGGRPGTGSRIRFPRVGGEQHRNKRTDRLQPDQIRFVRIATCQLLNFPIYM